MTKTDLTFGLHANAGNYWGGDRLVFCYALR